MSVSSAIINRQVFGLFFGLFLLLYPFAHVQGEEGGNSGPWAVPVKDMAIIDRNDQGKPLGHPSAVFFDDSMKEIYVITSNGRITIYGTEYGTNIFPLISLGKGRGVDRPTGLFVARDGRLFICQGRSLEKPARLTILNAALLPLKEIDISAIPGAESFIPHRVALGKNDKLYLVGLGFRGVMVLNQEGEFLHWLKPEDRILRSEEKESGNLPEANIGSKSAGGSPEVVKKDQQSAEMANLPDSLRPKIEKDSGDKGIGFGPVQITDLEIGENGYIFLLSEETGKVYIYNSREKFLFSFGKKGGSSGKLSRPRGLAVDEDRQSIFVVDYMRHAILVYNFAGRFLFEFGGQGTGPSWFNYPKDIALTDQGYLVVADLFNKRIQLLDVIFKGGSVLFGPAEE